MWAPVPSAGWWWGGICLPSALGNAWGLEQELRLERSEQRTNLWPTTYCLWPSLDLVRNLHFPWAQPFLDCKSDKRDTGLSHFLASKLSKMTGKVWQARGRRVLYPVLCPVRQCCGAVVLVCASQFWRCSSSPLAAQRMPLEVHVCTVDFT